MTMPTRVPARLGVLLVLVLTTGLAACSDLPESGPVVDASSRSSVDDERPNDITALPPTPGMSGSAVVTGFIDAMAASPINIDVAQLYLSDAAAAAWEPEAGTITYSYHQQPRDQRLRVSVEMVDAQRLDRSGAFLGRLSARDQTLEFDLTIEDGEYRITNPPDALVVSRGWFIQRFRPASLFYFDPTGRILVPEPVYVPRGEQLASNLVSRLVQGPGRTLSRVVRSYLPRGLDPGLSVPVTSDGVAEIDLTGGPGAVGAPGGERLLAQLAWTLRQDPSIRALRVTIDDVPVRGPDGDETYPVEAADLWSPLGPSPSRELYAVRDRALHVRDGNELDPVDGPFGGASPVRDAVPNLAGTRAVGVGVSGRRLLVARLDGFEGAEADVVLRGAADLDTPTWDFADRVWVVDRNGGEAVVHLVSGSRDRVVTVPGVSGRDVRAFLVSRDGTRIAAAVRGRLADELRVGRVEVDDLGSVSRVPRTQAIDVVPGLPLRVIDIAWASPTTIAELTPLESGAIYEVRTVGVDGSSSELQPTPVTGVATGLAGSPVPDLPTYVVTPTSIVDLTDGASYGFVGDPATQVHYAG